MIGKIRFIVAVTVFLLLSFIACFLFIFRPRNTNNTYIFSLMGRRIIFFILGLKVSIEGEDLLKKEGPFIIIGNHQTVLDVLIYGLLCPKNAIVIGKKEMIYIPIFGQLFWLLGHVRIDRQNHKNAIKVMDKMAKRIKKEKISVMIMPEGTRRYGQGLGQFKKGAFRLAIETQTPIIPIVVDQSVNHVDYNKWIAAEIKVKILDPISTHGLTIKETDLFIEKIRNIYLKELSAFDSSNFRLTFKS